MKFCESCQQPLQDPYRSSKLKLPNLPKFSLRPTYDRFVAYLAERKFITKVFASVFYTLIGATICGVILWSSTIGIYNIGGFAGRIIHINLKTTDPGQDYIAVWLGGLAVLASPFLLWLCLYGLRNVGREIIGK